MIAYLLILTSGLLAQDSPAFYGAVPQDVPTYTVTLPSGEQVRAGLRFQDQWVTDSAPSFEAGQRPVLVQDTPWAPQPEALAPLRRVQYTRVTPSIREAELKAGWEAAGYEFVKTARGEAPVLTEELALAQRAHEMATPALPEGEAMVLNSGAGAEEGTGNPGIMRWVGHAIIVLVGLGLAGFVVKQFVLEEDWQKV